MRAYTPEQVDSSRAGCRAASLLAPYHRVATRSILAGKGALRAIARRAMLERGLLPDFSPDVRSQAAALARAPPALEPALRDLRQMLWASIDNDDSRDL